MLVNNAANGRPAPDSGFPVLHSAGMPGMRNVSFTKETLLRMKLNRIR